VLIFAAALLCGVGAVLGFVFSGYFVMLLVVAVIIGGTSNPLYSLLIAYTNDFLEHDDMAAASGGMVFINGLGAVAGPLVTGWAMGAIGPRGFFAVIGVLMLAMAGYAAYRMTQRAAPSVDETESYAPVVASSSPVAVEAAQEYAIESAQVESAG